MLRPAIVVIALIAALGGAAAPAAADPYQPAPALVAAEGGDDLALPPPPRGRDDLFLGDAAVDAVIAALPPFVPAPWSFWVCSVAQVAIEVSPGQFVPGLTCTAPGFAYGTPGATFSVPIAQIINGTPPPVATGPVIPLIP